MRRVYRVGIVLAAVVATPAAAQQEEGGEEAVEVAPILVESATRTETPVDELSRSVSVVTKDDVEQQSRIDRSLGDILSKEVPGFSQSTEAATDFGQTLRGRPFLTLIDGVPQSTPLRDGRRSLNSIDADAIEQVEVVRGGTALYGFGATGGLVNIITRRPEDGTFNVGGTAGMSFSATSPGDSLGYDTNLRMSGRVGAVDYLANGSFVSRGGRFDADGDRIPADPVGAQGGVADSDTINFLGKLGFQIDDDQRFDLSGLYYKTEQDSEWAGISFAGDPAKDIKTPAVYGDFNPVNPGTENKNLNLEYSHADLFGSSVAAQVYYADIGIVYSKFPGFSQTRIDSEKIGSRLTVETPVEIGPLPFTLIWGVDYLHDETEQAATDGPTTSPLLEQDAIAGFAQIEIPIGDRALITGGVRQEHIGVDVSDFTRDDSTFVPGGRLTFDETLFNLTGTLFITDEIDLYGGFSQGFTVSDIGRSISDGTFATSSEAKSEAQKTDNYEIGLRGTFDRWDASIVGFYSTSDNGTSFDPDLNIVKQPEKIWGVEAAGSYLATDSLRLGGTVTWTQGKVDLDGVGGYEEDLDSTRIAPWKLTGYAEWSPQDWWSLRFQGLYSGNRDVNSTQFGGTSNIDDYAVFDLYGAVDVGPGQVQLGIENIFNADYTPVINQAYDVSYAYSRAPGTTISLGYSVDF